MDKRKITIDDLCNLKFISDPQISPNGEWVVFSVKTIHKEKNRYFSHLYLGDIVAKRVIQFTYGETNDHHPRWSPSGNEIAFIRENDLGTQIWRIPRSGGEARSITGMIEGSYGNLEWSPDGNRVLFEFRPIHQDWTKDARKKREETGCSNPPRVITRLNYRKEGQGFLDHRKHIWICDIDSGNVTQITNGDFDCRETVWSPDGKWISYLANRSADPESTPYKEDIYLLRLDENLTQLLPTPTGYKWGLSWSPDGNYIAYIGSETMDDPWCTHNDRVWVVPVYGGPSRCLTLAQDRIAENVTLSDVRDSGNQKPLWAGNGKDIFHIISDRGSSLLYKVNQEGNSHQVIGGKIDISGFSLDHHARKMAILAGTSISTADIFIYEGDLTKPGTLTQPFTQINAPLFEKIAISESEEIKIISEGNTEIQGWLLKPPDFSLEQKYPLILYIHGGPAAQYGFTFFHEFQVLAAAGYIVLYTNPRGSLGRETTFATAIQGNWGHLDFKDLMAAVDYAVNIDYVDRENMAVVGGSYGGFMATWIIGNTDLFQAAVSERAVSNRHSAVGSNDFPPLPDGYWAGNPWNKPETLWQQSPLRLADSIHTPLLIIHSEGDLRCPISQAEQLFSALRKLKRKVVFLRYPVETNHGLSRGGPPDLRMDRLYRIISWLDGHLKKKGS